MVYAVANGLDVVIAGIGSATAIVTVLVASHKQNKKLDKVEHSVATRNGKTSGEYIEDVWYRLPGLEAGQARLHKELAEHTVEDSAAFGSIDARLARLVKDVEELRERNS